MQNCFRCNLVGAETVETKSLSGRSAIFALYAMNFLVSSSFGAFGVIMPLYMRDVGVSLTGLGLAFGAFGIVAGAAGMFFGAHSDIIGRKPYLVLSLVLRAIVTLLYTQATNVVDFIILQALSGISASLSSAIVPALMTDLTKESERGRRFGGMGGFGWIGTGLGYFLGGAISQIFGYSISFTCLSVLTMVSCLLILMFVPSPHRIAGERFNLALVKGFSSNLKIWFLVSIASSLVIGPVEAMVIPLYVVEPGPLGMDKMLFGTFMSISYILSSSTQFIGGSLADRYSKRKLASFSRLLSSPFIMVQPFFPSFTFFATMYVFEGIGEGLGGPCNNAIVASSARLKHRGFDFSIVNLLGNIGGTIGFIGIGFFVDSAGFVLPFVLRAIVYVIVATLIYLKLKD
jgi:MFS family permease